MILLFDSLAHPNSSEKKYSQEGFKSLKNKMHRSGFKWACIVANPDSKNYEHNDFINLCRQYECFIPFALVNPLRSIPSLKKEISEIAKLGYKGIKIYPKGFNINWDYKSLKYILQFAYKNNLFIMLCTYLHTDLISYPDKNPIYPLVRLLRVAPKAKVILLHGGDVNLMKYAELVRPNKNLLLDLSFTIMKYKNSSVDSDIKFLFANFDKRICIGTDYPDYKHSEVKNRFKYFSKGLERSKQENIAYKNLINFLEIEYN